MQDNSSQGAAAASLAQRLVRSPLAWLCVLVAAAYAPIFWGQIIFFRDPAHWNFPARAFVRHAFLSGQFPHWNPYVGLGVPVWANPLYGMFYPPNWLLLLVPERLVASALTWQSAAHTLWGGAGMFVLAKQFRCGSVACLIGGIAWAFSGYTTSMWSAGLLLIADAWLPWVAVGFIAAATSYRRGEGAVHAIPKATLPLALALLCGEVFVAMISAGFGALTLWAWALGGHARDIANEQRALAAGQQKPWLRFAAVLASAVTLAFLIGTIVIAPARALVVGTPRAAGLPLSEAEQYSFHPIRLLELAAPEALGVPLMDYPAAKYAGEKAIDDAPLAFSSYLGAAVIGLALLAFGRNRRSAWMLLGYWCFFLLICFGRYTPIHAVWRQLVLPFQYMRYPEKYFVLLVGWTALLGSMGFDRLIKDRSLKPWRVLTLIVSLVAVLLLVGVFADFQLARYVRGGAARGLFAAVGLLCMFWFRKRQSSLLLPLAVAVVTLDLVTTLWHLQPFTDASVAQRMPPVAKAILDRTENKGLPPRLYRSRKATDNVSSFLKLDGFADTEALWMLTLSPNLGSVFGIATVPGYDAATFGTLNRFWEEGLEFRATLLRLLAVEYALLPVKDPATLDKRGAAYEAIMDPVPGTRLYRVKNPLPRAFLTANTLVLNDDDALLRLFTPEVADGKIALVAEGQGEKPMSGSTEPLGVCTSRAQGTNRLVATCTTARDGLAVFAEQFAPQWKATVDGAPAKLLRVNQVMRGVHITAGKHEVVMTYELPQVTSAAWVSMLAAIVCVLLIALNLRSKRRKGPVMAPLSDVHVS
ncbi:MAG: hypothetical protein SF187_00415 [Deltaproteobacteria bacterium]|nr:hypothetical protein [Deltaproteobacteria bacterium]